MGELTTEDKSARNTPIFTGQIGNIVNRAKSLVIFSLGTVSNTTEMPQSMVDCFITAFSRFPDIDFLWRMEAEKVLNHSNIHLLKWLPQKDLMSELARFQLHFNFRTPEDSTFDCPRWLQQFLRGLETRSSCCSNAVIR